MSQFSIFVGHAHDGSMFSYLFGFLVYIRLIYIKMNENKYWQTLLDAHYCAGNKNVNNQFS